MTSEIYWNAVNLLCKNISKCDNSKYAILILNTKINFKVDFFLNLWLNANIRVTVDGGTNRWYEWVAENLLDESIIPSPDFISGDFDSIDKRILEKLNEKRNVKIIETKDQNETDFTKAVRVLFNFCETRNTKLDSILAVVDTAGRLDQIMANINTLHKASTIYPEVNIFLLATDSLSWLLHKGKHKISIPEILCTKNAWCGLIPIGHQCENVTTTGFKWNLKNSVLKFGEMVSTSNTYGNNTSFVTIETNKSLLWIMGITELNLTNMNYNL